MIDTPPSSSGLIDSRPESELQREIARRHEVEQALRESEELHRVTLENISDAVFLTDDHLAFTFVCPNVNVIFGYSRDEARSLGRITKLLGENLCDPIGLAAAGEIRNVEWEALDKSGIRHSLLVHLKRVSIKGGTILFVCRDITDRKQAEVEQHEQLRFEALTGELSARFASLTDIEVGREIDQNLEALGKFLEVDRVSLWETAATRTELRVIHSWQSEGIKPPPAVIPAEQLPWMSKLLLGGKPVIVSRLADLPVEASAEREFLREKGVKSSLVIPLTIGGAVLGALACGAIRQQCDWQPDLTKKLQLVGEIFGAALARQRGAFATAAAFEEVEKLKDRLQADNVYLQEQVKLKYNHGEIVGQSDAIRQVLLQVEQVAGTPATVLLLGETGTGKELVARAIHAGSSRRDRPMVVLNCAALPPTLVESELFGREKGAYTGALTRQEGRFEQADGSTLFLDEIGDLPLEMQSKLLRVLQDGQFERLGGTKTLRADVRVLAATNHDLESAVKAGKFREDLYYRLNVFPIRLPPLRERREDIALLAWAFVKEFGRSMGKTIESITRPTMDSLMQYDWPGNVRELRNVIERAVIVSTGPALRIELPRRAAASGIAASESATLQEVERRHILAVLESTGWRVSGKNGAAEILGLKSTTLESRMAKFGIHRDRHPR